MKSRFRPFSCNLHIQFLVLMISLVIVSSASDTKAQTETTGAFRGQVLDENNVGIEGVRVRATDKLTGVPRMTKTTADGHFTMGLLLPGIYEIEISAPGYRKISMSHRIVAVDPTTLPPIVLMWETASANPTPIPTAIPTPEKPITDNLVKESRQLTQSELIKVWPSKSKRWALVVGVDQYSDEQINPLRGAAKDARTLADALERYAGFPSDQIILLSSDQTFDHQPTRRNILRFLSNLRGLVPKDGLLLLSFAGHGIERQNNSYLLPMDAVVSNDVALLEDTAVSVDRVKALIRSTQVGQVVMILDNCRNDPAAGRSVSDNKMTKTFSSSFDFDLRNRDVQAFATLYATSVNQRAYEYSQMKQGYFTWVLVEGLKGKAANQNGEVTLGQLVKYLQDNVPKYVQRDLGSDRQQKPYANIEGYRADELIVAITDRSNQR